MHHTHIKPPAPQRFLSLSYECFLLQNPCKDSELHALGIHPNKQLKGNRKHILMIKIAKPLLLFILISLIFGGCSVFKKPGKRINYYSLEYESPKIEIKQKLPFVLRVERFQTAPLYDTHKIIFREGPFKRDAYVYHRWLSNPGELISYFLARDLKASDGFKAVFSLDKGFSSSHTLQGAIDEFFELDDKDSWFAVLSVSITLLLEKEPNINKRILFQKKYSEKKGCSKKTPQSLAEAMSKAMSSISKQIGTDIYTHLSSTKR